MGEAVRTLQPTTGQDGGAQFDDRPFIIEQRGTEVQILIRNPREVTIDYMRRIIAKEYARLRRDVPRRKWGERSGRKQRIEERNRWYRVEYRRLRQERKRIAAERLMEVLLDEGKKWLGELGDISIERLKRILYGK